MPDHLPPARPGRLHHLRPALAPGPSRLLLQRQGSRALGRPAYRHRAGGVDPLFASRWLGQLLARRCPTAGRFRGGLCAGLAAQRLGGHTGRHPRDAATHQTTPWASAVSIWLGQWECVGQMPDPMRAWPDKSQASGRAPGANATPRVETHGYQQQVRVATGLGLTLPPDVCLTPTPGAAFTRNDTVWPAGTN